MMENSRSEHLIKKLKAFPGGYFPSALISEAISLKEEITPALLKLVESAADDPKAALKDDNWFPLVAAMYFLASFKEKRAFPSVLRLCRLPDETIDDLLGDFITEGLGRILASTYSGNIENLRALVTDKQAGEYVRSAALQAQVVLHRNEVISRSELTFYLQQLLIQLKGEKTHVHDTIPAICADIHLTELRTQLKAAFSTDEIDEDFIDLDFVEMKFSRPKEAVLAAFKSDIHNQYIDDPIKEMSWWAFFKEESDSEDDYDDDYFLDELLDDDFEDAPLTFVRTEPKIGRNDQCNCGSGKKYKKCCQSKIRD
jgi:uncharacterized protein YchJ